MALQNRTTGVPPVMNPCLDGDDQKVEPNGGSITSHRRDGLVSLVCLWSCLCLGSTSRSCHRLLDCIEWGNGEVSWTSRLVPLIPKEGIVLRLAK